MNDATHLDNPRAVPHTLQDQLAAHFSEIRPLHDKWLAVKFGRVPAEAHWRAEHDQAATSVKTASN